MSSFVSSPTTTLPDTYPAGRRMNLRRLFRRPDEWTADGWKHRRREGVVEVYVPYPIGLWQRCINQEHRHA